MSIVTARIGKLLLAALMVGNGVAGELPANLPVAKRLYTEKLFVSPALAKGGSALSKTDRLKNGKKMPVAQDKFGVAQYRIPQIIKTKNGRLVVAVSARLSLPSDYGMSTTFFAHSNDRGKSWEYIRRNTDYAAPTTVVGNTAGAFPLTEGTQDAVIMQHPKTGSFSAVYIDKKKSKVYTSQSKNLKSWSRPMAFNQNQKFSYLCPGPASPQVDPFDGSLVMMMHGRGKEDSSGKKLAKDGAYLLKSKDGVDFTFSTAPMPGTEAAVVPLGEGKYLAESRGKVRRLATFDGGILENVREFPGVSYPGCEASLATAGSNLYLLTPTVNKRHHGVLYRSKDKGITWQPLCTIDKSYFSYSSMTVLDEKHMAIVYESHFNPAKGKLMNIEFCVIEIPE